MGASGRTMGTRLSDRHATPHGDGPRHDDRDPRIAPEGFFGPSDHDRNHDDADRNAPTVGRRRKTVDTGIDRHPGQPGDPLWPISPAWLGQEAGTTAIPGRRPWHNDARKKGPAARRGLRAFEKGEPSGESVRRRDGKRVTPPRRFQSASVEARADRSRRAVHARPRKR